MQITNTQYILPLLFLFIRLFFPRGKPIVCSVTRSAYVAQARFACQYHISVFRQSQAPTVLYFFR